LAGILNEAEGKGRGENKVRVNLPQKTNIFFLRTYK
jgi:hypothetical protein